MLDREWAEWAAKAGALPAVAAALQQVSRSRPPPEIVARLTPGELEWVTEIVGRWPDRFPPGVLAALKGCTLTPQRPTSHQRAARTSVGMGRENVRVALSSTRGALLQRLSPLSLEIAEYVPEYVPEHAPKPLGGA